MVYSRIIFLTVLIVILEITNAIQIRVTKRTIGNTAITHGVNSDVVSTEGENTEKICAARINKDGVITDTVKTDGASAGGVYSNILNTGTVNPNEVYDDIVNTYGRNADSGRRIIDGDIPTNHPRYMIYLTKAEEAESDYDNWICGGTLISPSLAITSSACVEDVQRMYAIAGTRRYVPPNMINVDPCTKCSKRRVIKKCVPREYEFTYKDQIKWANKDIAIVEMEKPYPGDDDDDDDPCQSVCDFRPRRIFFANITDYRNQPNQGGIVLGWGSATRYRNDTETEDTNSPTIREVPVHLINIEECKNAWGPQWSDVIERNMICSFGSAHPEDNLHYNRDEVYTIKSNEAIKNRNQTFQRPVDGLNKARCKDIDGNRKAVPKKLTIALSKNHSNSEDGDDDFFYSDGRRVFRTRRQGNSYVTKQMRGVSTKAGICQNDHGGPIVRRGIHMDMMMGVASAFRLNKNLECVGPFLFTSLNLHRDFIDCIYNYHSRRNFDGCGNQIPGIDFDVINYDWND